MARANKRDTAIRHALEAIGAELAVVKIELPLVKLRIEQARDRTGLDDLLTPAMDKVVDVVMALREAERQVGAALKEVCE